jgi:hypothetical protein
MQRVRERIEEVDGAPLDFVVVSARPTVVSFRVTEHLTRRDVVDLRGHTLRRVSPRTEHYVVIITRFTIHAPWRLLVIERQGPPIEVQL